jgi:hypothetical protein
MGMKIWNRLSVCTHLGLWKETLEILTGTLLTCWILDKKMLLLAKVTENKTNVEELHLLGYNSVYSAEKQSTFRRNMSPSIFRIVE